MQELNEAYGHGTRSFPRINIELSQASVAKHVKDYLFAQKLLDIDYDGVLREAIEHYQIAIKTINDEFKSYSVPLSRTQQYSQDIVYQFEVEFRKAVRNCTDTIRDSQNLYDVVIGSAPATFLCFASTPLSFRNGLLHSAMNDKDKGLKWKVKANE